MPERPPIVEQQELAKRFAISAQNMRGEEEVVGAFERQDDGVRFLPNTEKQAYGAPALEEVFRGLVEEHLNPQGARTYHVFFDADAPHLYRSMIIGVRRSRKNGDAPPEIMASMGPHGDEYWTWKLTEEQWRRMDHWLQMSLKKIDPRT